MVYTFLNAASKYRIQNICWIPYCNFSVIFTVIFSDIIYVYSYICTLMIFFYSDILRSSKVVRVKSEDSMTHHEEWWDSDLDHMIDQWEEEGVIMELGVEVCMTECVEEVVAMTVVCVSNDHRLLSFSRSWHFVKKYRNDSNYNTYQVWNLDNQFFLTNHVTKDWKGMERHLKLVFECGWTWFACLWAWLFW